MSTRGRTHLTAGEWGEVSSPSRRQGTHARRTQRRGRSPPGVGSKNGPANPGISTGSRVRAASAKGSTRTRGGRPRATTPTCQDTRRAILRLTARLLSPKSAPHPERPDIPAATGPGPVSRERKLPPRRAASQTRRIDGWQCAEGPHVSGHARSNTCSTLSVGTATFVHMFDRTCVRVAPAAVAAQLVVPPPRTVGGGRYTWSGKSGRTDVTKSFPGGHR